MCAVLIKNRLLLVLVLTVSFNHYYYFISIIGSIPYYSLFVFGFFYSLRFRVLSCVHVCVCVFFFYMYVSIYLYVLPGSLLLFQCFLSLSQSFPCLNEKVRSVSVGVACIPGQRQSVFFHVALRSVLVFVFPLFLLCFFHGSLV